MPWRLLALGNAHVQRFKTQYGKSVLEMSDERPTLVVFLRQFHCTFCKEALSDIAHHRPIIEAQGHQLCLVNLSVEDQATTVLSRYGLQDVAVITNPDGELYQAFDLERGSWWQVLGPKVLWRSIFAGIINGHGLPTAIDGDSMQMPGVFLLHKGKIIKSFKHKSAADRPDYLSLLGDESCQRQTAPKSSAGYA